MWCIECFRNKVGLELLKLLSEFASCGGPRRQHQHRSYFIVIYDFQNLTIVTLITENPNQINC